MPYDETLPARAPRICGAVVVPPPLNGMALVSQQMLRGFGASGGVTQPDRVPRALWPVWRHLSLSRQIMRAEGEVLYFVPDAGRGLRLNALEARLMRRFDHVVLHHHVFSYLNAYDARFARFRAALEDNVSHIMLSDNMGKKLKNLYGLDDPVTVLGNSLSVVGGPKPPRTHLKRLGFLSNITPEKGIEAVMGVARALPEVEIQIAGPAAESSLRRQIEAFVAEAPGTRRWLGPVQGASKARFLAETDLLLFPTRYANEAQPLVIFEALAAGTPVLATPRGCIPEQLQDTGWVLPEVRFVEAACAVITKLRAQPAAFAEASRTATSLLARHQARDQAAMHALQAQFGRA
jgi:glycosyltransferase involved in cell wall biosynthesis